DRIPQALTVLPQPGPRHIYQQDDDRLRAAAVPPEGVQGCPEGLGGRVQPDDRPLALALGAEQAPALDAGKVADQSFVAQQHGAASFALARPGEGGPPGPSDPCYSRPAATRAASPSRCLQCECAV